MPSYAITHQLDIYNAAGTSVYLTLTSIAGGTNPYLADSEPVGDGQEFNPLTGSTRRGQYTGRIIDAVTSGTDRVVTSRLEDAGFRQQLMRRKAILTMIVDGATTVVLCAGLLTELRLVNTLEYQYTVTDRTRVQGEQKIFAPRAGVVTLTASALAGATSLSCSALPIAIAKNEELNFGAGKTGVVAAAAAAGATTLSVTGLGIGGSASLALADGDQATYKESLAAFLTRWPKRGCAFGGPVIGGFLGRSDSGGWTMRYELLGGSVPFLRFINGAGPTAAAVYTDINHDSLAPLTNDAVGPFREGDEAGDVAITTFKQAAKSHFANDLVIDVIGVGYYAPDIFQPETGAALNYFRNDTDHFLVDVDKNRQGVVLVSGTGLIPGKVYRVRAITAEVSELSPIYDTAHPVAWATTILTELGYAYDSASATTVTGLIGADLLYSDQITAPENGATWLADTILGPFGIGLRQGDDGEVEFFSSRVFSNAAPATTITDDDVITPEEGGAGEVFAISESTAIAAVTFAHNSLFALGSQTSTPTFRIANRKAATADGIVKRPIRIERLNGDSGVVGNQTHAWSVNGMVHRVGSYVPANDFLDLAIREIFDRFGRGVIECELPLLRGGTGDSLRIGDECIVRVSQIPNRNKRYGDAAAVGGRAMQIVRYTPRASGALVKLLDSGPNASAYATAPTVSIGAASGAFNAKRVAALTITNAATLNADGAGAYVLMAVNSGTPAATDYARVMWFNPGEIPTAAFRLPTLIEGRRVWAKAVAFKPGYRTSSASSAANVTLSAISIITGLTITPDGTDGSTVEVEWTVGETDHFVDVFRRPTSGTDASDDVRIAELAPESDRFTDAAAMPGVDYTYSVQHRHPVQGDTSSLVSDTATTAGGASTLSVPIGVRGFAGPQDAAFGLDDTPGLYGIAVRANFHPSQIEAEASVDGGTTYSSIGLVPGRQGTWTPVTDIGANDGVVRTLRARLFRPGHSRRDCIASYTLAEVGAMDLATAGALSSSVLASDWSDTVTVTPYTAQAIQHTGKTLRIPAADFHSEATTYTFLSGAGRNTTKTLNRLRRSVELPVGAAIVGFRGRGISKSANAEVTFNLLKSSDETETGLLSVAGLIDDAADTYETAEATLTAAETTDGSAYYATVDLDDSSATSAGDARFAWVEVDYESPALDVSL